MLNFSDVVCDGMLLSAGVAGCLFPSITSFGPIGQALGPYFQFLLRLTMIAESLAFILAGLWGIVLYANGPSVSGRSIVFQRRTAWVLISLLLMGSIFDLLLGTDLISTDAKDAESGLFLRLWNHLARAHPQRVAHLRDRLQCHEPADCVLLLMHVGGAHLIRHGLVGLLLSFILALLLYIKTISSPPISIEYEPLLSAPRH